MPADGFAPIRDAVARLHGATRLTLLLGGNNAVTRPAAHGLGLPLDKVGLITLDAHFDMRDTDQGPMNGNPVRCLLEDGLPGREHLPDRPRALRQYRARCTGMRAAAGIGVYDLSPTAGARHRRGASTRRSRGSSASSRRSWSISTST